MRLSTAAGVALALLLAVDVALRVTGRGDFPWPVTVYLAVSLVTLLVYGWDKRRAGKGGRRVPESTLHLLALFGGWPGALVARPLFRHKTKKQPFSAIFWVIGALHVAAWIWFASS